MSRIVSAMGTAWQDVEWTSSVPTFTKQLATAFRNTQQVNCQSNRVMNTHIHPIRMDTRTC